MTRGLNLDLTSLSKAIALLEVALSEYKKQKNNELIRDATIQRFEYTYELCYKMLKRYLEMTEASAQEVDQLAFPNLIRTGSERDLLLNGWDRWNLYRNARNMTSHVYDEKKALEVCQIIPDFFEEASFLVNKLQERIAKS